MKIKEYVKNRFDGGRADDIRLAKSNEFGNSINFDIFTQPSLLVPVRDYETDQAYNGSNTGLKASDVACFGNTTSTIYAVGRKNDGTGRKIYNKSISSTTWLATTASDGSAAESASGCAVPGFFIRNFSTSGGSLLWFVTGSHDTPTASFWTLGLLDFDASAAADFSKKTLIFNPTFYPQAVLGQDGVVYISDDYKIHGCNPDKSIESSAFTVSRNFDITSLCIYDTYLAIAIYGQGRSKVILWDYNQAQATEVIEWGDGALMVLENLNGYLVGVTDYYVNSTTFGAASNGQGMMEIKAWKGDFVGSKEIPAYGTTTGAIPQFKATQDGVLRWYAKIPQEDGSYLEGIWACSIDPFAVVLEREIPGSSFEGFWGIAKYLYFPHSGDGSVSRTNSTDSFTLTSTLETEIIDDDNPTTEKNALGAFVTFKSLPENATINLKYRKDGATSWTSLTATPTVSESDLSAFFPFDINFRELELRAESTNGAVITSIRCRYEVLSSQVD